MHVFVLRLNIMFITSV